MLANNLAYVITLAVFASTVVTQPLQSSGWYWDTGNAIGLLGFAGMLYLFLDVGVRRRHRIHQLLSYAFAACLLIHVMWIWLGDPTVWHYLAADAPAYMVAGLISFMLVTGMMVLALPTTRRYWHADHRQFRRWHYALSLMAIATAYWHIVGSGFYVSPFEAGILMAVTLAVVAMHRQNSAPPTSAGLISLWALPLIAGLFVGAKSIGLALIASAAGN